MRVLRYSHRPFIAVLALLVSLTLFAPSVGATCIAPTNFPPPPVGGMTYVNWTFGTRLSSYQQSFTIHNNPGLDSALFLQMYDGMIDGQGYYVGIQTSALAIFSKFGTTNLADVRPGPAAYEVAGTDEGPYVSLRQNYALPAGTYTIRVARAEFDGNGDWFDYYLARSGESGNGTYIGGIRFQRANPTQPATLPDGGGTWTEYWPNNGNVLLPVPYWKLSFNIPLGNGTVAARSARTNYSAMPNSDIYYDDSVGQVKTELGGTTPRCHAASNFQLIINPPAAVITPITPRSPTPTPTTPTTPDIPEAPAAGPPPELGTTPTRQLVELDPTTLVKFALGDPTALAASDDKTPEQLTVSGDRYWLPPLDRLEHIDRVVYALDGEEVYTATGGLFGYQLDTTWMKNGEHTLQITVHFKDGEPSSTINTVFTTKNNPSTFARLKRTIARPYHWLFEALGV